MDKIIIEGGIPLEGEVQISGAKNAALPILAATLLAAGEHRLSNVPPLADIRTCKRLLGNLGVQFREEAAGSSLPKILIADTRELTGSEAPYELVKTMRAAVLVLGPLVARARQGQGLPARRLRHRGPAHQPPSQGAGGHGGKNQPGPGLRGGRRPAASRGRDLPGRRHGHRHREPDDGRHPGQRHHGD